MSRNLTTPVSTWFPPGLLISSNIVRHQHSMKQCVDELRTEVNTLKNMILQLQENQALMRKEMERLVILINEQTTIPQNSSNILPATTASPNFPLMPSQSSGGWSQPSSQDSGVFVEDTLGYWEANAAFRGETSSTDYN